MNILIIQNVPCLLHVFFYLINYIKENNRYGLDGNNINYNLFIYPECKLARTTVRTKINNDPKLRRAINITAELLQLDIYHPYLKSEGLLCTPQELYEDIKKLGYDWNVLLETRGYWTPNQYEHPIEQIEGVVTAGSVTIDG